MKKYIASLILSLLYCVSVWSSDGDTFTAYVDVPKISSWSTQVEMTFKIVSELDKTCQVGDGINRAIDGYPDLTRLELPDKVNNYKIVRIGDYAFAQGGLCDITTVVLPSYVTSIGKRAFYLSNLESITFPTDLNTIGEEAFANSKIASIDIPSTVSDIGNRAFASCTKLTSFTIPSGVSVLKSGLFSGCTKLSDIIWHNGVTSIGIGVFTGCTSLASVSIPESVTSIGVSAFYGCTNLSTVNLSSNLQMIDQYTFNECTSLRSITIPTKVTSIGAGSFWGCSQLESISIPGNVITTIGYGAFVDCNNLISITIGSTTPMAIYENTFTNRANATLYIPSGCKAAYEAADYWKEFKEIVEMAAVKLSKSKVTIEKGKTLTLKANVTPETLEDKSVTWKSSNTKVATVSNSGKVKGVKTGTATITCTSVATGMSATCKVTVGKVNLDKYEASILKGTSMTLTPSVYPTTLADKSVTWKSSNTDIATVTPEGKVKGVNAGIATITCSSVATGLSATCQVTVTSTVHLSAAGTLSDYISEEEKYQIEELTLTGKINGTDFRLLRDMGGNNYLGQKTVGKLKYLDMTGVEIVSGGLKYLETDWISYNSTSKVGVHKDQVNVESNKFPYAVFAGCTINTVLIPQSVTAICDGSFSYSQLASIVIPNSVISIGFYAFNGCQGLNSISIPSSVTYIGNDAFSNCSNLESIKVESGNTIYDSRNNCNAIIETAYNSLIKGCSNTIIPNSVISINGGAFRGCQGLHSISIPSSVTYIGNEAFFGCSGLSSIKVESGNSIYDSRDNCNAIIESSTNTIIVGCKNSTIPTSVTTIGNRAFYDCGSLTSIVIPNSVTTIGDEAFFDCDMLSSVTIPNSVTTIGDYAFYDCKNLSSVIIPNSVTYIGDFAFANCFDITDIYCFAEKVPETASIIFSHPDSPKSTLYVPEGSLEAYREAAPWSSFKNIVGIVGVELSKSKATIMKGKTMTLKVTVYPEDLVDKSVTWKSSNTKVATVTSAGEVKGVKTGTATITCTSVATGMSATCKVTIGKVNLDKSEAIILKGTTFKLTPTVYPTTLKDKSVTWKSSNTKVATVTSAGEVKGVKTGIVTITCTSKATGLSATCEVTVGKVNLDKTEVSIVKGKTVTLVPSVYPTTLDDKSVTWTSSNKAIASVTTDGKVKGIKAGTATITCISNVTGLSATCQVTVTASSGTRSLSGDDDETTGIDGIDALGESETKTKPYDVYDLSGRMVLHQVTSLDGLPNGVYIVNGRKVLKK